MGVGPGWVHFRLEGSNGRKSFVVILWYSTWVMDWQGTRRLIVWPAACSWGTELSFIIFVPLILHLLLSAVCLFLPSFLPPVLYHFLPPPFIILNNIKVDLREVGWGAYNGSIWLRIGTGGGLLRIRWWTFGFHKMRWICWVTEDVLASQEGLCSMELVKAVKELGQQFCPVAGWRMTAWSICLCTPVVWSCKSTDVFTVIRGWLLDFAQARSALFIATS